MAHYSQYTSQAATGIKLMSMDIILYLHGSHGNYCQNNEVAM